MAENPATWKRLEHAIQEAINQHSKGLAGGAMGSTLTKQIAEKLRAEGLVQEASMTPRGDLAALLAGLEAEYGPIPDEVVAYVNGLFRPA